MTALPSLSLLTGHLAPASLVGYRRDLVAYECFCAPTAVPLEAASLEYVWACKNRSHGEGRHSATNTTEGQGGHACTQESSPFTYSLAKWYPRIFWPVIGLIFMGAVIVAWRTGLRRAARAPVDFTERKALKALRPFGFEDADIFVRLQREQNLWECLDAITDLAFRFGILCGDSGCGKTSFLQAGLWPALLKQTTPYQCVYVKFTDHDPLDTLRQALAEKFQLPHDMAATAEVLTLLESVAPPGSPPLVLLFDQFEQFFVHHKRKEDRLRCSLSCQGHIAIEGCA